MGRGELTEHSDDDWLLLESVLVAGDTVHERCWERVLDTYLDDATKDYRPPRFLLNDLVRYWRTICVDFVGRWPRARRLRPLDRDARRRADAGRAGPRAARQRRAVRRIRAGPAGRRRARGRAAALLFETPLVVLVREYGGF